jgi:hypothetical protein
VAVAAGEHICVLYMRGEERNEALAARVFLAQRALDRYPTGSTAPSGSTPATP